VGLHFFGQKAENVLGLMQSLNKRVFAAWIIGNNF
jgi:hypothetical protein